MMIKIDARIIAVKLFTTGFLSFLTLQTEVKKTGQCHFRNAQQHHANE
jgi:hypothetical protein